MTPALAPPKAAVIADATSLMHSMAARARTLVDAQPDLLESSAAGIAGCEEMSRGEMLEAVLNRDFARHAALLDGKGDC